MISYILIPIRWITVLILCCISLMKFHQWLIISFFRIIFCFDHWSWGDTRNREGWNITVGYHQLLYYRQAVIWSFWITKRRAAWLQGHGSVSRYRRREAVHLRKTEIECFDEATRKHILWFSNYQLGSESVLPLWLQTHGMSTRQKREKRTHRDI